MGSEEKDYKLMEQLIDLAAATDLEAMMATLPEQKLATLKEWINLLTETAIGMHKAMGIDDLKHIVYASITQGFVLGHNWVWHHGSLWK